jgi:hypothetical protein
MKKAMAPASTVVARAATKATSIGIVDILSFCQMSAMGGKRTIAGYAAMVG